MNTPALSIPAFPEAVTPIFIALDNPDVKTSLALIAELAPYGVSFKLGLEFFCACGPEGVLKIKDIIYASIATNAIRPRIFLDLKLHDIPNTVAAAVNSVARLGVDFLTIHAGGGANMMKEAQKSSEEAAKQYNLPPLALIAVSVLTSLDQEDLLSLGISPPAQPQHQVARLANLAYEAGIRHLVCSPLEIGMVKSVCPELKLITPGVRPIPSSLLASGGAELGDQKRVLTPREALDRGADWLVIGRPVTAQPNPAQALQGIIASLTNN